MLFKSERINERQFQKLLKDAFRQTPRHQELKRALKTLNISIYGGRGAPQALRQLRALNKQFEDSRLEMREDTRDFFYKFMKREKKREQVRKQHSIQSLQQERAMEAEGSAQKAKHSALDAPELARSASVAQTAQSEAASSIFQEKKTPSPAPGSSEESVQAAKKAALQLPDIDIG
ncbi:MAG: hypothetical protein A3B74_05020 [Candidatus Kerfeldbacteria bacterium RIFCSPHIGHO2_02_FULL_42_14]|uniref:Uncharacterized protein n=1 Tax=Candidatus Kerfeldbacteria bacterium RIFCSPHIGHO2_02_FULL_42_14 TaxID=1798540 RepID=A0A1G2ASU8_9BACT|nr:MAG: hypothetical protein A3B74_05020 [Candidatus Kerfeldbacteria bacterium RIFCSPHIGHO2_02_FULL_42_14]OGY81370.1 MAG: hypothetical protein A3E60_01620 [Candidatus Kerfeldbacteria bacterium RIFCSPHIGHO2_12_FULL_42_13]OGY83243.1 MAG: hypothetical protein A3I91_03645 [Candidatus Kerfeldbacteria bacterium RIFCSPLOWO2_02_FULL_42_19]OGY85700.1 MAG: hypothetical protein A3G01_00045 [Candidatus Kerfeldbacteria bacterium RIFCSPLOWO2_12_FULL_43_9]